MQLDKIIAYHKALADPTRFRMLILLAQEERNGQVLAEQLALTPATITHHAAKLRAVGVLRERREKNLVFFSLDEELLKAYAAGSQELIYRHASQDIANKEGGSPMDPMVEEKHAKLRQSVLKSFYQSDGRLKSLPVQLKKKLIVLEDLIARLQLEQGQSYPEREINRRIGAFHEDYATIRREFIMHQYMFREKEAYELNPQELWAKWRLLS